MKKRDIKKVVFIRHGQSEYNVENKFYGWHDPDLTDLGREQALEVAAKIADYIEPDAVLCSDLKRAVNTATPIAEKFGLEPIQLEAFREINVGDWEGMTYPEIKASYPEEIENWENSKKKFRFPSGENYIDLYERAKKELDLQLEKYDNIILVSHFGLIESLLSGIFFGNPISENGFHAENAKIIKFALKGERAVLYNFNM